MSSTKRIFFLAGLARSGSTLLGSILNQHADVHVTPTSPVLDIVCTVDGCFANLQTQYTYDDKAMRHNVTAKVLEGVYANIAKPVVFDKHRGWPRNISIAQTFIPDFKGIVTYRPIPEILTSFIKLFDKDSSNFVDAHLAKDRRPINNRNRADYLWRFYMQDPYNSTVSGLANYGDRILPISYSSIVDDTRESLAKIEDFFGVSNLKDLPLAGITNTCAEAKDEAWGVKDLHTIRPDILATSDDPVGTLGQELVEFYSNFNLKI